MEEASGAAGSSDQGAELGDGEGTSPSSEPDGPTTTTSTTLVEVAPNVIVALGDFPGGLDLTDFGLVPMGFGLLPSNDREQLSEALSTIGNTATIAGNISNTIASAQGVYRVTDATLAALNSGAKLAAKDGAYLGTMLTNGSFAQARFIPYSVTAAQAAAAIGPAVAMLALQMMLSEVSGLVGANIALTAQTLKTIRHDQWSELTGLSKAVDRAISEATRVEAVTTSVWEPVSGSSAVLDKQLDQYRLNVKDHIRQLRDARGTARRQYLETNAEAVLFDANALLLSLKAHTGYQALRVARARINGAEDENEARLADEITGDVRAEFDVALTEAGELVDGLARELRIISELPGRATMPLTKRRRDATTSRLTCGELLEVIQPLADALLHPAEELVVPGVVCAPEGIELDAYMHILRWHMENDETLRGIAFPYEPGSHNIAGLLPPILGMRVDATWDALLPGKLSSVVDRVAASTFVAVTDRRIITAVPRSLLHHGAIADAILLRDIQYVRPPSKQGSGVRTTVDVVTDTKNIRWLFPSTAGEADIDRLVALVEEGAAGQKRADAAIERSSASVDDDVPHLKGQPQ